MKIGDIVTIHNYKATGERIEEGEAKLLKLEIINGNEWYHVEFLDEPGTKYLRRIL